MDAVEMKRKDVQWAVNLFAQKFQDMIASYSDQNKFPINSPLEIRITGLDDPTNVPTGGRSVAYTPFLSSLTVDKTSKKNGWDVGVWFDILTIPGTEHSNEFYFEFETWLLQTFNGNRAKVRPEWSKGWAYTDQGPWMNEDFLTHVRNTFTEDRDTGDTWNWEVETLKKYDRKNLFTSPFVEMLFKRN